MNAGKVGRSVASIGRIRRFLDGFPRVICPTGYNCRIGAMTFVSQPVKLSPVGHFCLDFDGRVVDVGEESI